MLRKQLEVNQRIEKRYMKFKFKLRPLIPTKTSETTVIIRNPRNNSRNTGSTAETPSLALESSETVYV